MMPHDQESSITSSPAAKFIGCNTMENMLSVHVDHHQRLTGNVIPCPDNQVQDNGHREATPVQSSVLRVSLHPITLRFEDVSYTINLTNTRGNFFTSSSQSKATRIILNGVTGIVRPGELLAMLGPSGSGKTTLLTAIAGRLPGKISGSITYNNQRFSSTIKRKTGFVTQDDVLYPHLTVIETLTYTALLRLPKKLSRDEKVEQAEMIITDLGLTRCRNSIIGGSNFVRGLSGGERKRVSIGQEMLVNPSLLLLDEPTSGLDSNSAFNVMQTLRSITDSRHRTVILSIHQPSFKILSTIDEILLLSKGMVVHHGTLPSLQAFLLSNGFTVPQQLNALEYAMEILNQLQYNKSVEQTQIPNDSTIPETSKGKEISYRSSRIHEIITLYGRFLKIIYRTKQLLLTNAFQALGVGLVLGTIYINIGYDKSGVEKRLGLFAFTLTFLLSSTTETLPIFINERPILLRETSSGVYRLSSYLIANTLVFFPYLFAIAIVYSVSVYFLVGLCASWHAFTYFVLVIWVIILMANSFVLFLSSVAPNYIAGTSLVTILLAGFFLFSGYFISKDSMPKFWLFMNYLSMYKYALDALLINEYSCLLTRCMVWVDDVNKTCMFTGRDVLDRRGLHEKQRWTNVYVLVGFFVFYRLLCLIVLRRRISMLKK